MIRTQDLGQDYFLLFTNANNAMFVQRRDFSVAIFTLHFYYKFKSCNKLLFWKENTAYNDFSEFDELDYSLPWIVKRNDENGSDSQRDRHFEFRLMPPKHPKFIISCWFLSNAGEQLSNTRRSDKKFYSVVTDSIFKEIVDSYSGAKLICDTTKLTRVPRNIFHAPSEK